MHIIPHFLTYIASDITHTHNTRTYTHTHTKHTHTTHTHNTHTHTHTRTPVTFSEQRLGIVIEDVLSEDDSTDAAAVAVSAFTEMVP